MKLTFQLKLLNGFVLRLLLFQCIAASEKSMLRGATFIDWPKKLRGKRGKGLSPPKNKTENGKRVTEQKLSNKERILNMY